MRAIDLPRSEWRKLDELVAEFEGAQLRGGAPTIEEFLIRSQVEREVVLVELVHGDIECRLRAGDTIDVDEYLRRFPELSNNNSIRQELLATLQEAGKTLTYGVNSEARFQTRELPCSFGRYELQELLGHGAMGAVYRAFDSELQRDVALKLSHRTTEDDRQRFRREAQAAATVRHAGVCRIYDFGEISGELFITMELISGRTLSEVLDEQAISFRRAAELVLQIAQGLSALHAAGVVHRDLKPTNTIIAESGFPVLTDFGLARSFVQPDSKLTQTGTPVGTPAYMAPEQISGSAEVGPRSDIYSLGVIFYELLTNRRPFEGPVFRVMQRIVDEETDGPRAVDPEVPPEFDVVCRKMLARNQNERFQSAADVIIAIGQALEQQEAANDTVADPSASGGQWYRHTAPITLGMFLFGVAVAGVILVIKSGDQTTRIKTHGPTTIYIEEDADDESIDSKTLAGHAGATNSIGMALVNIPAGEFPMGSPEDEEGRNANEGPQHVVRITRSFWMGASEVTVAQFRSFVDDTDYLTDAERGGLTWIFDPAQGKWDQVAGLSWQKPGFAQIGDHPVTCVSWNDAVAFCRWLTAKESQEYRLPTEAEWEYACRAGSTTPFHFGTSLSSGQANFNGGLPYKAVAGQFLQRPAVVASYEPNAFGLFDMHGNLLEYCSDSYADGTDELPETAPRGRASGAMRVARGGGWHYAAVHLRSAYRFPVFPNAPATVNGFRIVCEMPPHDHQKLP